MSLCWGATDYGKGAKCGVMYFCLFPNTTGQVTIWQIKPPTLTTLSDGASIG